MKSHNRTISTTYYNRHNLNSNIIYHISKKNNNQSAMNTAKSSPNPGDFSRNFQRFRFELWLGASAGHLRFGHCHRFNDHPTRPKADIDCSQELVGCDVRQRTAANVRAEDILALWSPCRPCSVHGECFGGAFGVMNDNLAGFLMLNWKRLIDWMGNI